MALEIRKKGNLNFTHVPSEDGFPSQLAYSNLLASIEGDLLVLKQADGEGVGSWNYSKIAVYDETDAGTEETFASAQLLWDRLIALGYTAFSRASASGAYTSYVALIRQSGTNAPTATVLNNTLGVTMTWARGSAGQYTVTASSAIFDQEKTWFNWAYNNQGEGFFVEMSRNSTTVIRFNSFDTDNYYDDLLDYVPLEIRVYS